MMESFSSGHHVPKEQLEGYTKISELPRGAVRLEERLMPWREYIAAENSICQGLCLGAGQMVWLIKTRYPIYSTRCGIVKDAEVREVWDGTTGEFLCIEITGTSIVSRDSQVFQSTMLS